MQQLHAHTHLQLMGMSSQRSLAQHAPSQTSTPSTCTPAGNLSYDDAVLSYLARLDDHRKKCELEGRYEEARAASNRLADLKTAQVERLRQELVANQSRELEDVNKVCVCVCIDST